VTGTNRDGRISFRPGLCFATAGKSGWALASLRQRGSRGGVGAGILTWKRRFATEARYCKDAATFCYLSGGGVIT